MDCSWYLTLFSFTETNYIPVEDEPQSEDEGIQDEGIRYSLYILKKNNIYLLI